MNIQSNIQQCGKCPQGTHLRVCGANQNMKCMATVVRTPGNSGLQRERIGSNGGQEQNRNQQGFVAGSTVTRYIKSFHLHLNEQAPKGR